MALTVTHAYVSAVADSGDTNVVQPSDWNDDHVVTGANEITISNKTSAYTVVAGDLGAIINCTSGTFTVSLTAAATLGAGFNCWVWNTSGTATHVITIDPNASETIDGRTTITLRRGEGTQIVCDGTNWQTGDKKRMRGYAENIDTGLARPEASGALDIAIGCGGAQATGGNGIALGFAASTTAAGGTSIGCNSGGNGSQVVTGAGAVAIGGSYASGTDSFAAGIANNTSSYGATGANSVAIGSSAKASGAGAVAIGSSNQATSTNSVSIGSGSTASNVHSIAIGYQAVASDENSVAIGPYAKSDKNGKIAFASFPFSVAGDGQGAMTLPVSTTTDATPKVLTVQGGAAGATNQVILPNNSAYAFDGLVVSRRQAADGTESAAWKVEGLIRREANAGTTTLVTSTVTAISNVPGWTLALTADTTNGGLAVTFTGAAATDIRTVANIRTVEVTYA